MPSYTKREVRLRCGSYFWFSESKHCSRDLEEDCSTGRTYLIDRGVLVSVRNVAKERSVQKHPEK